MVRTTFKIIIDKRMPKYQKAQAEREAAELHCINN